MKTQLLKTYYMVIKRYIFRFITAIKPAQESTHRTYENIPTQFKTIRNLLDSLDDTFSRIKRMSPRRGSFQSHIKKYGPFVVGDMSYRGDKSCLRTGVLEGLDVYGLPAVLINYWPVRNKLSTIEDDAEIFFCAIKTKRIFNYISKSGCIYYECSITSGAEDRIKMQDLGYYIEVERVTGKVTAIKYPYTKQNVIHGNGGDETIYYTKEWHMPDYRNDSVVKKDNQKSTPHEDAVKQHLEKLFTLNYNITMHREYGVNIIVKKGKSRATFTVPQDRWKYFFKDRIKAKTIRGNTKPIYHSVTAHARKVRAGITNVKTHYRGSRHFLWDGYEIKIVMQGKHSSPQASFGVAGVSVEHMEPGVKYSSLGKTATLVNETFEGV